MYIVSLFLLNIVCILINTVLSNMYKVVITSFTNFVFFPAESNGGEFKII